MDSQITITFFGPKHQADVDTLLEGIQREYTELIYGPDTKKMNEVTLLPGRKYWVALDQGKVIGTIGVMMLSSNNACLKSMMVQKEYRGREMKISNALLAAAMNYAVEQNAVNVFLGTMIQFKAAHRFYLKHGFTMISENQLPADFVKNPVDKVFFMNRL